jgi:hypothetical protein
MIVKVLSSSIVSLAVVCFLFLAGCASEKPVRSMTNAETSLQRAREARAIDYAPLELRLAEEKLQAARQAMDKKEYKQARSLAEEAQAHAQLAEAEARSGQSQKVAQEMRQSIETLRSELASRPAATTMQ